MNFAKVEKRGIIREGAFIWINIIAHDYHGVMQGFTMNSDISNTKTKLMRYELQSPA